MLVALLNIPYGVVEILGTHHPLRSWLKAVASSNMNSILVTEEVSHSDKSWLKAVALVNMDPILVTEEVFHSDKGWLKRRNAYTKPKFANVKGSVPTGSKFCDGDNCEL